MSRAGTTAALRRRMKSATQAAAAALLIVAGCTHGSAPPPAAGPEATRARAALALLFVENQTGHRLTILYRFANRSAPDVGIGFIDAGQTAELAPVPAGEPLIMIARTATGAELSVGPRTFPIDGSWRWRIDRSARFQEQPRTS